MSDVNVTVLSKDSEGLPTASGLPPSPVPDLVLEKELGRGGMGIVYRARQTYLDRAVALKLLLTPGGPGAEEFVRRFQREAKILATLHHPHIVACYQAGLTAAGQPYLAMEFIDGPNLQQWVAQHGALSPEQGAVVIRDLALALDHAHQQGIIHRDVKPDNVLLAKKSQPLPGDSFPWTAKLVDLGLARPVTAGDMSLTRQGTIMGTPATMAPEQFDDPEGVDFRADIYGLGCILHYAVTGIPAYDATSLAQLISQKLHDPVPDPGKIRRDLPDPVRALTCALLARNRQDRPASYGELIQRCEKVALATAAAPTHHLARWFGAGVGVLVLGSAAWLLFRQPVSASPPPPVPTTVAVAPPTTPVPTLAATPGKPAVPQGQLVFGPGKSVWLFDQARRLSEWTTVGNGVWTSAEERPDAVVGTLGRTWRKIGEPLPWRITATLYLANQPKRRSDKAQLGVVLADGSTAGLTVINLGGIFHTQVNLYPADAPEAPSQTFGPHTMEAAEAVEVTLLVNDESLIASAAGPFDKTILPSPPVGLYLGAMGTKAPVEIAGLRLQTALP